jgi:hypothetical protein
MIATWSDNSSRDDDAKQNMLFVFFGLSGNFSLLTITFINPGAQKLKSYFLGSSTDEAVNIRRGNA